MEGDLQKWGKKYRNDKLYKLQVIQGSRMTKGSALFARKRRKMFTDLCEKFNEVEHLDGFLLKWVLEERVWLIEEKCYLSRNTDQNGLL